MANKIINQHELPNGYLWEIIGRTQLGCFEQLCMMRDEDCCYYVQLDRHMQINNEHWYAFLEGELQPWAASELLELVYMEDQGD